jgi:hypothetical protein
MTPDEVNPSDEIRSDASLSRHSSFNRSFVIRHWSFTFDRVLDALHERAGGVTCDVDPLGAL